MPTSHNDTVFAKFMVALSKKIIDRQDARAAAHEQLKLDLEALANNSANGAVRLKAAQHLISNSANPTASMNAALSGLSIAGFARASALVQPTYSQNDITADEMEVIRAYHAGEDVLEVLLRQER